MANTDPLYRGDTVGEVIDKLNTQLSNLNEAIDDLEAFGGVSIQAELNTETYVLSFKLVNNTGDVVSEAEVDFPLESVVVNGQYDEINKEIELVLQNGNKIEIPVGNIINGLATTADLANYLPKTGGTLTGALTTDNVTVPAGKRIQTNSIYAPTASNGTTYGAGSNGQVLKSNGTTVYWGNDNNDDTKVTQAYSTDNGFYPLLMSATAGVSSTATRGATTAILNNVFYANPSTGELHAKTISGEYITATQTITAGRLAVSSGVGIDFTEGSKKVSIWIDGDIGDGETLLYENDEGTHEFVFSDGSYPNMTVGNATNATNATTASKVANNLTIYTGASATANTYNGSAARTVGNSANPITYAVNATNATNAALAELATKATNDADGNRIYQYTKMVTLTNVGKTITVDDYSDYVPVQVYNDELKLIVVDITLGSGEFTITADKTLGTIYVMLMHI